MLRKYNWLIVKRYSFIVNNKTWNELFLNYDYFSSANIILVFLVGTYTYNSENQTYIKHFPHEYIFIIFSFQKLECFCLYHEVHIKKWLQTVYCKFTYFRKTIIYVKNTSKLSIIPLPVTLQNGRFILSPKISI